MQITADAKVADVATADPATIRVFQQHKIDFCCGGKIPIAEACEQQGIDTDSLIAELRSVQRESVAGADWRTAAFAELVTHIQRTYHEPLRSELPRLSAMMTKVVQAHGTHLPETLLPLQRTYEELQAELLHHMAKEDRELFPEILRLEAHASSDQPGGWTWIDGAVRAMEADHDTAGAALAKMREMTGDYTPPEWSCPTFRGLYHGLSELEREMHVHVHLENHILFPRATARAHEVSASATA
ncbi:MAG TPA: iron-sulfur cluster repair di-iron protein [Vicinamibacterales bacterium]|nr:iron-sulfur cluster repair di-iron protein [Vicinamibacterales bacterium]